MTREPPDCVCGHPDVEHHAWTGPCIGDCGCSYFLPDSGFEPAPGKHPVEPYNGIYGKDYKL